MEWDKDSHQSREKAWLTWAMWISGSVHTTLEKFENGALFLRLGLPSTLMFQENEAFANAVHDQTRGIQKRWFFVFLRTENILKT